MSDVLKRCPCGAIPNELYVTDTGQGGKWANVCGSCCGYWQIEFRTQYARPESAKMKQLATEAWNEADRCFALEGEGNG